ncbi:hypothetical protein, partial [Klebsiella pneumoniae]|uniref:hypothetical protein n=1 Tax=Klebsiella pneumoniae TaxID=573 RepID=UPI003BF430FE
EKENKVDHCICSAPSNNEQIHKMIKIQNKPNRISGVPHLSVIKPMQIANLVPSNQSEGKFVQHLMGLLTFHD